MPDPGPGPSLDHYSYYKTYDPSENFLNDFFITPSTRVKSAAECETHAFNNKSSAFILTDFSNVTMDASCHYFDSRNYSDGSLNDWLSGLGQCVITSDGTNSCYEISGNEISGNDYFGLADNLSLYLSPVMNLLVDQRDRPMPTPTRAYFDSVYQSASENLNQYLAYRETYLYLYYNNVKEDGTFEDSIKTTITGAENDMNTSQEKLEADLFQLNNIYNDLIMMTAELNRSAYADGVDKIQSSLNESKKYLNVLMNKNAGAIGELDITRYNKSLAIFENIVIAIAILSIILIYVRMRG